LRKGEIWNLINRIIWSDDKQSYFVIIVDRLERSRERLISGNEIRKVYSNGLIELIDGGLIPIHRVIEIRYKDKVLFTRKKSL
jgi:uncharacterized protein (UPF0248 family)